jgi:hypothetical protein
MGKVNIKEETQSDPLGKYAFPNERLPDFKVPEEIDTKIEKQLIGNIDDHFSGDEKLSKKSIKLVQSFLKNGLYSDVFKEPDCEKVYRGMGVSLGWLQLLLKTFKVPDKGKIKVKFLYKPLKDRGGSSWSTSESFAQNWALDICHDVAITLIANVSDNKQKFAIGENGLYKLRDPAFYKNQQEAVGLGTIKVSEIEWIVR